MKYRIAKLLNHNSFIGLEGNSNQECLIMGKGVAFGKKVGQTIEVPQDTRVYSLKELTERGDAREIINSVSPVCLELANEVLREAEKEFGKVDRSILFPMADHLDLRSGVSRRESRSAILSRKTSVSCFTRNTRWLAV